MKGLQRSSTLQGTYRRFLLIAVLIILAGCFALFSRRLPHPRKGISPVQSSTSTVVAPSGLLNTTLVVASTSREHTEWLTTQFPHAQTALYVADDSTSTSPFRTPANKGNEAMVYLTYIIDHYDRLPSVAIFIHAHLRSKHTDDLLGNSMLETLQRLRLDKVRRDGYFNLRCNWRPGGCPRYMNLHDPELSVFEGSTQAHTLRQAWRELFPDTVALPEWVGQTYGAQFAASRGAIRSIPLQTWVRWRDWLLATELSDYESGRVWEYSWQYVLAGKTVFCPSMDQCYCEGYGVCFGGESALEDWSRKRRELEKSWATYLSKKQAGRESMETKRNLMVQRNVLDQVLKEAKVRGDGRRGPMKTELLAEIP